jgi:hypothetical protein
MSENVGLCLGSLEAETSSCQLNRAKIPETKYVDKVLKTFLLKEKIISLKGNHQHSAVKDCVRTCASMLG